MTANIALAPLRGTNALYDTLGVDFFYDADLKSGESQGDAQHVEWVEYDGAAEFDEDTADQILRDAGFVASVVTSKVYLPSLRSVISILCPFSNLSADST